METIERSPLRGEYISWIGNGVYTDRSRVPDGYFSRLYNCSVRNGVLQKFYGWEQWDVQITVGSPSANSVLGLTSYPVQVKGVAPYVSTIDMAGVFGDNLAIYMGDVDGWTAVAPYTSIAPTGGSGAYMEQYPDFTVFMGDLIGCSKILGFKIVRAASVLTYQIFSEITTAATGPRLVCAFGRRIAVINDFDNMYFTDIDTTTISNKAQQMITLRQKGAKAIKMIADATRIYVFYPDEIYAVEGYGRFSWRGYTYIPGIGCESKQSVVEFEGWIYFANRQGIYRFRNGVEPQMIFKFFDKFSVDGTNWMSSDGANYFNRYTRASISPKTREYVFAYRSTSASEAAPDKAIFINIDNLSSYEVTSFPAEGLTAYKGKLVFSASQNYTGVDGKQVILSVCLPNSASIYTFEGTAFAMQAITKHYFFGTPLAINQFVMASLHCHVNADANKGDIVVSASIDGKDNITLATIDTATTGKLYGDWSELTGTRAFIFSNTGLAENETVTGTFIGYTITVTGKGNNKIYGIGQYYRPKTIGQVIGVPM